jgi:leucyl/phenylalanyl-tRNA--protein transferase
MPVALLSNKLEFPSPDSARSDGLLAVGGDLRPERLILAYRKGIFPWFSDDTPLWWCPDPRFVLIPSELNISKSMQQLLRKHAFDFTVNLAFDKVIEHCGSLPRRGQSGTWITGGMKKAYRELHRAGYAQSAEVWQDGKLAGGLYGIRMGPFFFGESMFSLVSNASKYAFICFTRQLQQEGVELIDCQVYTEHLKSLGAKMMPRKIFLNKLEQGLKGNP